MQKIYRTDLLPINFCFGTYFKKNNTPHRNFNLSAKKINSRDDEIIKMKKKTPSYFYNLRQKKKLEKMSKPVNFTRSQFKCKWSSSGGSKFNLFNSSKNVFRKNDFFRNMTFFKLSFRDFLLHSQLSNRFSLKNYKNPLYFSFLGGYEASSRNRLLFKYRKLLEDRLNLNRSRALRLRQRRRFFFNFFKKIIVSKNFYALFKIFNTDVIAPNAEKNEFTQLNSRGFNSCFEINRKFIKKNKRGYFKASPVFNVERFKPTIMTGRFFAPVAANFKASPTVVYNIFLLAKLTRSPLFSSSLFYFFHFIIQLFKRHCLILGNNTLKKNKQNIFFYTNAAFATIFSALFNKLNSAKRKNFPFISLNHFIWSMHHIKAAISLSNKNSNFFRYSPVRSNILFSKNIFNPVRGRKKANNKYFLNAYIKTLFNFIYPAKKLQKTLPSLVYSNFYFNHFKNFNFKATRSRKQSFDYTLLSIENTSPKLLYNSRSIFVSSRVKIWQPRLQSLVSHYSNIYIDPINNLLFVYKNKKLFNYQKSRKISILKNNYSSFKFILKLLYSTLSRRVFSLLENQMLAPFFTAQRRAAVNVKIKVLGDFLKLLLRSTTKEFNEVTSAFCATLRSLSVWYISDPSTESTTSTIVGLSSADNFLNNSIERIYNLSYSTWLKQVWNLPSSIANCELSMNIDVKTKRLSLGLDLIPKRALIFNGHEKNNFSTYYSCNLLAFSKLVTFYLGLVDNNDSFGLLGKLFSRGKQLASIKNSLLFYGKGSSYAKIFNINRFVEKKSFFFRTFSIKFTRIWTLISNNYGPTVAKFLFSFSLQIFFLQNRYKVNSPFTFSRNSFKNFSYFKGAPLKKTFDFWITFSNIYKKFRYFVKRLFYVPFFLILFSSGPSFKPFFKATPNNQFAVSVRKFINSLNCHKNYSKLALSANQKKTFTSKIFIEEYFAKFLSIKKSNKILTQNKKIFDAVPSSHSVFFNCALVLTSYYYRGFANRKFILYENIYNVSGRKPFGEIFSFFRADLHNYSSSNYRNRALFDLQSNISDQFLKVIGWRKDPKLFKTLHNIYFYKHVVIGRIKYKLLSSQYFNILNENKFSKSFKKTFSDNPLVSFPQLKTRPQRLFKNNPDAKGRDRVFYYLQKKPKFLHKFNKPFRFLRIYTPRINLSSNLLATHGVNRHIVERNSRRSTPRVARKRKYYLHHIWRKQFDCSSTTLFYKWKKINQTKRKWLSYFFQFENSLSNYIWFARLVNHKRRILSVIEGGLIYVNGLACFDSKYSVKPGDVISLSNEAFIILTTRRVAGYLKRKIGGGSYPMNIKKKFLGKLVRLLQKDVAFGTNAAMRVIPERSFLIQQAAKFLSADFSLSAAKPEKKMAPGGARFDFSDINFADLSSFDAKEEFSKKSMEVAYWKKVISRFYSKIDSTKKYDGRFYYRYKNHIFVKRYPYSAHEWFSSSRRRTTDVYNPLNIETWISHKYWK